MSTYKPQSSKRIERTNYQKTGIRNRIKLVSFSFDKLLFSCL